MRRLLDALRRRNGSRPAQPSQSPGNPLSYPRTPGTSLANGGRVPVAAAVRPTPLMWDAYVRAGKPYGDTLPDCLRWCDDMQRDYRAGAARDPRIQTPPRGDAEPL